MKKYFTNIIWFAAFIFIIGAVVRFGGIETIQNEQVQANKVSTQAQPHVAQIHDYSQYVNNEQLETKQAIELAVKYIIDSYNEKTGFVYQVSLKDDDLIKPDYNIVRHSGVIHSLDQYMTLLPDGKHRSEAKKIIVKASEYLITKSMMDVPEYENTMAIFDMDENGEVKYPPRASIGAQSLGLMAMLSGGKDVASLTRFIESMKLEQRVGINNSGKYAHRYRPWETGKSFQFQSEYYDGELALAFVKLGIKKKSMKYIQEAFEIIYFKATTLFSRGRLYSDHWSVKAIALMEPYKNKLDQNKWIRCWWYANGCMKQSLGEYTDGRLNKHGTSAQTATRLEAILSGYDLADQKVKDDIEANVHQAISYLKRFQVTSGDNAGCVVRGGNRFEKGYSRSRIDYTQHFLSALILYHERYEKDIEYVTVRKKE